MTEPTRPATVLCRGLGFVEGPVHLAAGGIVFVSLSDGRVYKLSIQGAVSTLSSPGGAPNGAVELADGTILVARNGGHCPDVELPRTDAGIIWVRDGEWGWVTRAPIAPNDLCMGPDGLVYFTDPSRVRAKDDGRIWRCDPTGSDLELLARVPWFPNGIGFGKSDELVVSSTGDGYLWRYEVGDAGLEEPDLLGQTSGGPDGFAFDIDGNVVVAVVGDDDTPGCLEVWSADGERLERVHLGSSRYYTNVALSGEHELVVTDSDNGAIMQISDWPSAGLPLYPFRDV